MKLLLCLIFFLPLTCCVAQEAPDFSVKSRSKAVLKISYRDNRKVRTIITYTENVLPHSGEFRLDDSLLIGTRDKYITYEVTSPQKGYFAIDHYGATIYLVPNDTLVLSIDLSHSNPWQSYRFIGKYASINQYYFDQARVLKGLPAYSRALLANEIPTLSLYKQKMDSLLLVEQQYLSEYSEQHSLPAWFIKKEKQQIRYGDAFYRTNAVAFRRFIRMDSVDAVPANFYRFVTPAFLNDPSATHLVDYHNFLNEYFLQVYLKQKRVKLPVDYIPVLASRHLSGPAWDVFMARFLDTYLAAMPTTGEQLLAKYQAKFTDKRWIDELKKQYQDAYTLKPGQLAPNFALEDHLDSLAYLKDFRGQVVYLSFWFTGCAPCRQEMPFENKLVDYFAGKAVKVVSICVRSSRPDWAKVSKLYKLQTVNLFANPAWERTLIDKYAVKGYPHYVLIDQEGKVVKNNCSRPSDGAKKEIEALLAQ